MSKLTELNPTEYIVLKRYQKPLRYDSTSQEIMIFSNGKDAEEWAKTAGGVAVSCHDINTIPLYTKVKQALLNQLNKYKQ